jgi:hypothetical protein
LALNGNRPFMGVAAKERANVLLEEIRRRQLKYHTHTLAGRAAVSSALLRLRRARSNVEIHEMTMIVR